MQYAVAFVDPAGFLIDEIEEVAARLEAELLANRLFADGIERAGARGVDESELIGDLHLSGDRGDTECDPEFHGNFGADFDDVAPGGETFSGEIKAIDSEGQVLKDEVSVGGNLESALEAVAFAEEATFGGEAGAFWVADFETEFAAEALGAGRDSGGEPEDACEEREACETEFGPLCVHCKKKDRDYWRFDGSFESAGISKIACVGEEAEQAAWKLIGIEADS